jgi:hypothetical protein
MKGADLLPSLYCAICGKEGWQSDNFVYVYDKLTHRTCYEGAMKLIGQPLKEQVNKLNDIITQINSGEL